MVAKGAQKGQEDNKKKPATNESVNANIKRILVIIERSPNGLFKLELIEKFLVSVKDSLSSTTEPGRISDYGD